MRIVVHALNERFFSSSSTVTIDGKEFKLTPELLAIERKTFKQSSECHGSYHYFNR